MSPFELLLSRLEPYGVRKTPAGARAFCPAHQRAPHKPGRSRSLVISQNADGDALVKCHAAECPTYDIVSALGLDLSDLFHDRKRPAVSGLEKDQCDAKIKGWSWWSLASVLDATVDALVLPTLALADADQAGDLKAGRAALAGAVVVLREFESKIRGGAK